MTRPPPPPPPTPTLVATAVGRALLTLMGAGPETMDDALLFLRFAPWPPRPCWCARSPRGVPRPSRHGHAARGRGANAVNLSLDLLLVLGLHWGVGGAAIATTTAEASPSCWCRALTWCASSGQRCRPQRSSRSASCL